MKLFSIRLTTPPLYIIALLLAIFAPVIIYWFFDPPWTVPVGISLVLLAIFMVLPWSDLDAKPREHPNRFANALLKVADLYENSPEALDFYAEKVPRKKEGCFGCPLAWAGFFLDEPPGTSADIVAQKYLDEKDFYLFASRMNDLQILVARYAVEAWQHDPALASKLLREYVKRYYPLGMGS